MGDPTQHQHHLTIGILVLLLQAACGADEALDAEVDELGERVAVLEATGFGDDGSGGDGGSSADSSVEDRLAALEAEVSSLRSQVDAQASLETRLATVETTIAEVDDQIGALSTEVEDISETLASTDTPGGVWFEEGTGLGTCARVNVVTTSAQPLIVLATVEVDASGEISWCAEGYSSSSCTSYIATHPSTWEVSGEIVVHTQNVGGTSFTSESTRSFLRSRASTGYANLDYNNIIRTEQFEDSSVESISTVVSIPTAGSYTVEAQVSSTGTVGTCRLVVLQQ